MNPARRERFDRLLEEVLEELPEAIHLLLEEVPVIVEDQPSRRVLEDMGEPGPSRLCGLHTGIPLTHRSVLDSGTLPEDIQIYRRGIWAAARDEHGKVSDQALRKQIRLTLLHEIGHHFGMTEQDLEELGYG